MRHGWLLLVSLVLFMAYPAGSTNATGGYITPVNLSIDQPLAHWYFFYGNSTGSASTMLLNSTDSTDLSNNSTAVYFSTTYSVYFISDVSLPFGSPFAAPNLTDFDAHFQIPEPESVLKVFNDSSSFALVSTSGASAGTLDLPTLYIPGTGNAQAFREGIVQAGSSFLFVVPRSPAAGLDGQTYDYQFFLPYNYNGSQTFYTFTVVPPATTTTTTPSGSGGGEQPLDYNWAYHDGQFDMSTEPEATLVLIDELGKSYTFRADQAGQIITSLSPGRYTIRVSKIGFISMTDNLYIPTTAFPLQPPEPKPPVQAPASIVSITRTPEGNIICFDSDCYLQEAGAGGSLQELTELSCTGSICRLVGVDRALFVQMHGLKPYGAGLRSRSGAAGGPLNFSAMLDALGRGLSQQLGPAGTGSPAILVVFAIAALVGAWVMLHLRSVRVRKGGYD